MSETLSFNDIKITNQVINVCGIFIFTNDFENIINNSGYIINENKNNDFKIYKI